LEVGIVGENNRTVLAYEDPLLNTRGARVLWTWRNLAEEAVMFQVGGGGGDSGVHNKPAGCGVSEACVSGLGRVNLNVHGVSTRNSAHVILSIFYVLTQTLNFYLKLNILYM
jgi:hypothetical protein